MKRIILTALIAYAGLITGCSKSGTEPNGSSAQVLSNQKYGADPLQDMDVYLPANHSSAQTKTMIMIHGGAWTEGDKTDFKPYIDSLKKRLPAYAIININYRLSNSSSNLFPAQENDVKAAINYIYDHRYDYNISDQFVLLGASAGAHLALLQAFKYSVPLHPKAVVNFFGPSDMKDMYDHPASSYASPAIIQSIVGATPASNPDLYFQSSPINFISAESPPVITLQGGIDPLVNPSQQTNLQAKLNAAGVPNQYVFYPAESHGWGGTNLTNSFDRIEAFLQQYVP